MMRRKPSLAIAILEKDKGGKRGMQEEKEESYSSEAMNDAGADVLDAIKGGDPEEFSAALKDFIDICGVAASEDD